MEKKVSSQRKEFVALIDGEVFESRSFPHPADDRWLDSGAGVAEVPVAVHDLAEDRLELQLLAQPKSLLIAHSR